MEVRAARNADQWRDAAHLLFRYQRETAADLGKDPPDRPEQVWAPVRSEVLEPVSVFTTYLLAYDGHHPLGGVALIAHDALTVMLTRCYVHPDARRRGVAAALVTAAADEAARRGAARLVLDILASRDGAITAWRRLGFVDSECRGDTAMRYLEREVVYGEGRPWLGLRRGEVALHDHDERWSTVFLHHAEVVRRALAGHVGGVEHVGSTAVEGLVAKPVVDLAVQLTLAGDDEKVMSSLEAQRYVFRGDKNDHGGLLFVAEDQAHCRTAHLHVLRHDDPQWERYLKVRDLLRTDEGARRHYAAFKRELAGRFPEDRRAYTVAKGSFIEAVLAERR